MLDGLNSLSTPISGVLEDVKAFATSTAGIATGVAVGGAFLGGVGATLISGAVKKSKRKTTKKKRKSTAKRKYPKRKKIKSKRRKGRRTPRTAGKGKDRSTKRIRYTKKGQPYVIMKSGKARFIKKTSAKRSHKLKGGRY